MHKIEIGKVGNFSAWNEIFRAEISDFFNFFAERKLLLPTLIRTQLVKLLKHEHARILVMRRFGYLRVVQFSIFLAQNRGSDF